MAPLLGPDPALADGLFDIDVVCDASQRTRVARLTHRYPLRSSTPMYLDDADRGRAFICVQNPTAGAFPDDTLHTRVHAAEGSRLYLAPQAATQVFAGAGIARHDYVFRVDAHAVLEHIAKPLIPHAGSAYWQRMHVSVVPHGCAILGETVAAGRLAYGERFTFDSVRLDTCVAIDGTLRARDSLQLTAQVHDLSQPGLFGPHNYLSTFTVIAPTADTESLTGAIHDALAASTVTGAVSPLPDSIGVMARYLSYRGPEVTAVMEHLAGRTRQVLLGPHAGTPRRRM